MVVAQASKIVCYNPTYPYLVLIPTVLLSAGMLFFFTLGSSMVGDICDEDELKTGHRSEGSFYSVFWWFIKMGTALASLIAGALIVFTLFDETQVTKVDSLQGNIRELRSDIEYWQGDQGLSGTNTIMLQNTKKQVSEAIDDSKLYVKVLEKESVKEQSETYQKVAEYKNQRKSKLSEVILSTKSTISKLETLQMQLGNINTQSPDSLTKTISITAIPLILQPKLEKARLNSFELLAHLQGKSLETEKSKEHFDKIILNTKGVDKKLANISTNMPLDQLDKELSKLETDLVQLTIQSPYTLLMMRVVEIGLPMLLSIFSIFFVLKYSLTEKRSHEIKDLLKKRNANHANVEINAKRPHWEDS
jgi:hypothetical protein